MRLLSAAPALLLAALLLATPALGQGAPAPNVTIAASNDTVVVTRESDATMTLQVGFESQNPFDTIQQRDIHITLSTPPAGWGVVVEPVNLKMSAGDTATVDVTITLGAGAQQSEVQLTFTAQLVPRGDVPPEIGGVIEPEATAQTQVTLKREDPLTREVLENVGGWIWAVLGGLAILAVVLALVLARGNRPVVALTSGVKQAHVAPGRSVAIPVVIENLTSVEDTVIFHVAPVRDGWAASLPLPDLALDGRRREELHLVVTAPANARPGDAIQVGLTAHGAQNPKRPAELVLEIAVSDTPARRAAGDTTPADVQREQADAAARVARQGSRADKSSHSGRS